jgi:hypothetical protein
VLFFSGAAGKSIDPFNSIDVWAAPEEDEEEGICDDILETRWQEVRERGGGMGGGGLYQSRR